jgi:hypothetical protein
MLNHERETNKPIDATPTTMLKTFLTTGRGWISRKGIDLVSKSLIALGTWEAAKGVPTDVITSETAFGLAAATWLIDLGLSRLADKANKELPPPAK